MVQPLNKTPGFKEVPPSVIQQEQPTDPTKTGSVPTEVSPRQPLAAQSEQPPAPGVGPLRGTIDVSPEEKDKSQVRPDAPNTQTGASTLTPDNSPLQIDIPDFSSILESLSDPTFGIEQKEVEPPITDNQYDVEELRGYNSVLANILNTPPEPEVVPDPKHDHSSHADTNAPIVDGLRYGSRAEGANPHLLSVVQKALKYLPEGYEVQVGHQGGKRTRAEQAKLVEKGVSKTMNSYHLTGNALDLQPVIGGVNKFDSHNTEDWKPLADAMKRASKELGIPVEWGGDWKNSWDKPHWQIPRNWQPTA